MTTAQALAQSNRSLILSPESENLQSLSEAISKVAQLYNPALLLIELGQRVERFVERKQRSVRFKGKSWRGSGIQGTLHISAASLRIPKEPLWPG
ncbi:MAG: hypothetical protein WCB68_11490 [Pyrinomonadaceae bacterium]